MQENVVFSSVDREVYVAISKSTRKIWEANFQEAQEIVAKYEEISLCAALAKSESLLWIYSMEHTDASLDNAMNSYTKLEEQAMRMNEACKPPSVLSSISNFFGTPKKISEEKQATMANDYIETLVALADISGGIAMLFLRSQQRMKAAYRLRKAWKYYQEAYEHVMQHKEWSKMVPKDTIVTNDDPESVQQVWEQLIRPPPIDEDLTGEELRARNILGRLIFGRGLFCYTISMLPKSLQWLVELIGFSSDRQQGLKDVLSATKITPSPRSNWARAALGTIRYFFFDETEQAMSLVEEMLKEVANSPMLCVTIAGMYRVEGKIEESSEKYREAYEHASQVPSYQLVAHYELGHNYFLVGEWAKAVPLIEEYLEKSKSPNFKAFGGYKLGICYWILEGEAALEKIRVLFARVINEWKRPNMSYDAYAARHCQTFLDNNSFSVLQILFVEISNFEDAKMFKEAEEKLKQAEMLLEDGNCRVNEKALFLYWKGHLLQKTEDNVAALKIFNELVQLYDDIEEDKWIVAYAELESIEIFIKTKDFERAQMVLNELKKRSRYDFEKHVSMRVKKLQSKISSNSQK